jgi:hypothetical protein
MENNLTKNKIEEDESKQMMKYICASAHVSTEDVSAEEVQNKIDQVNYNYSEKDDDYESTINLNDSLFRSVKNKQKDENKIVAVNEEVSGNIKFISEDNREMKSKFSQFEVINQDIYLKPFEHRIRERVDGFRALLNQIEKYEHNINTFSEGYHSLGLNVTEKGITFKEYAPAALSMSIVSF